MKFGTLSYFSIDIGLMNHADWLIFFRWSSNHQPDELCTLGDTWQQCTLVSICPLLCHKIGYTHPIDSKGRRRFCVIKRSFSKYVWFIVTIPIERWSAFNMMGYVTGFLQGIFHDFPTVVWLINALTLAIPFGTSPYVSLKSWNFIISIDLSQNS